MWFNPLIDPFVETGYLGYSLRGIAHRQPDRTFRPSLEIRDYRYARGDVLSEHVFTETFDDADAAIERALGKGRQLVDDLIELMSHEERIES
jgi:hypothetical protein